MRLLGGRPRPRPATLGLLACLALLAGLVAASLVLLSRGGGGAAGAAEPSATATFSSRNILFGDTVQATLDLIVPRTMARTRFAGQPDFAPFRIVSRHVERTDLGGGMERIVLRYGLTCLSLHCVTARPFLHLHFRPTTITIPGGRLRAVWPPLVQVSRVQDVTAPVTDGLDTGPAVPPGLQPRLDTHEALGAAAFSLLVLLAAWLYLRRRAQLRLALAARQATLLQTLLARVEAGLPEDVLYRQRHALDALAVELRHLHVDGGLAVRAQRLAWAPEQPDPEEIRSLVDQVRRLVKS